MNNNSGSQSPIHFAVLITFLIILTSCTALQSGAEHDEENASRAETEVTLPDAGQLAEKVIVRRTDYGVPHIKAEDYTSAGYALGYVQMEDYGQDVIEPMIRARGEWVLYKEPKISDFESQIDSDAFNQLVHERAVETFEKQDPETQEFVRGFAAGMNRYIERYGDELDDWVRADITPYDVHARIIGTPSRASIRRFLSQLEDIEDQEDPTGIIRPDERASLDAGFDTRDSVSLPDNNIWARLAAEGEFEHPDAGSNAWALTPDRTENGNAILMRNPHLSWDAGYYEAGITIPGELNFYGDFRIGRALGIIGGFNENLGWATTNNSVKTDEIYAFEADPDQPDHFLVDGESVPIERETVEVTFRHGDSKGTETREFLQSSYGPVIHRGHGYVYVQKDTDDGEFRVGDQFLRMMRASNLHEWQEAMRLRAHPRSNLLYADREGNAYYVWNATTPNLPHESGYDTTAVFAKHEPHMWQDVIEWEVLPQLLNPAGGYVRNENDPFHFTNLNQTFQADDFPSHFPEPQLRLRSQHSLELIHNDELFSLEDIVELKHSKRMLIADRVKDDLVEAVRDSDPDEEMREAIDLIEEWDNTVARDSRGALLFNIWWDGYRDKADSSDDQQSTPEAVGYSANADSLFAKPWSIDKPAETPQGLANKEAAVEAFEWALEETVNRHGDWKLAWGEVHRARIGDIDVPVGGCSGLPGCFRMLWFTDHDEDEKKRQVRGGDGWVSAVEFSDPPRAYTILAYGQSNKEESPHYNDQLKMFADGEMKKVRFTEEDIQEHIIREYHPGKEEERANK